MVKYRYADGKVETQTQKSPFGYVVIDEDSFEFIRYTPLQIIVRVELIGKNAGDFISGIQQVYGMLMDQENREKFRVWITTNADKITVDRVLRERVEQYSEIKTIDILSEGRESLRTSVPLIEKEFGDVAFTRDELIDKVFQALRGKQVVIARALFEEIFTPQGLESRRPNETEAFRKLLELVSMSEDVSDSFVQRAYDLQKEHVRI
jgi:hypothetical protein